MFREYSRNISRKYSLDINEKHSLNIFRKYSLDITAANIREYSYQCGNVQGIFSEYFSQIFAGHYPCEYSRIFGVSWVHTAKLGSMVYNFCSRWSTCIASLDKLTEVITTRPTDLPGFSTVE